MINRLIFGARKTLVILFSSAPLVVGASIDINPKILEVKDKVSIVHVINSGDTPEFVEITLSLIENPGVPPEHERRTQMGIVKSPELYAAPFKLTLAPRQSKVVKLYTIISPKVEKAYRLSVIPQHKISIKDTLTNIVFVSLGYDALVRHLPSKQIEAWRFKCSGPEINLEATGTVRISFVDVLQDGLRVDDFNVYPDSPRVFKAKKLTGKINGTEFIAQCVG